MTRTIDVLIAYEHVLAGQSLALWLSKEVPGVCVQYAPLDDAWSSLIRGQFKPRMILLEASNAHEVGDKFGAGLGGVIVRTNWGTAETAVRVQDGWMPVSEVEVRELVREVCRQATTGYGQDAATKGVAPTPSLGE